MRESEDGAAAAKRSAAVTQQQPAKLTGTEQYLCGVAGGLGKVFTGHPFDTVKGRVQSGAFPTASAALRDTLKKEGVTALYQGVLPPCISVGIVSGVLFWANTRIRAALQPDPNAPLTYTQMGIAGGGAGAVTAMILTPLDQVKIWLQVERRHAGSAAGASSSAGLTGGHVRRVLSNIGAGQTYRGFTATTLREVGTFGIFFPLNEYFKACIAAAIGHDASTGQPLPLSYRLAAAGTAGVLCWLPCYPIDQIKTQQQLQGHPLLCKDGQVAMGRGKSMPRVAAEILKEQGQAGFWRGIAPCLLRAFPTYATQFVIYDALVAKVLASKRAA